MKILMKPINADLNSVKLINLPFDIAENGQLTVLESQADIPFLISRTFVVMSNYGLIRGKHAHKLCNQFLFCPYGKIEVFCDDGIKNNIFTLEKPNIGLLIPNGIWAEQTYLKDNSVLVVLCDRPYENNDYIRHYSDFKKYRSVF